MGIFNHCKAAAGLTPRTPEATNWGPDGTGVMEDGDDVGGDIQDGKSFSVRYVRPDLPGALITVTYYPVTQIAGEWGVERQVEFMVCDDPADPGGTEIWSETATDSVIDVVIYSQAAAEQSACEFAEAALDEAWQHGWGGQPGGSSDQGQMVGIYDNGYEIYRAHKINGPDDGPAMADYIVRRDSDGRYGGYITDLAEDGDPDADGDRFEVYDDAGQYITATQSLRGAVSVLSHQARHWIAG
jgi:hypothetical protein